MVLLYLAVLCTALAAVPCSCQQSAPTYPWKDAQTGEAVTCEMCPPGTYVGSHCTKNKRTQCLSCVDSLYTEYWNYVEECLMCDYPCSEVQEEVQGCNATHNRVCQCKEGYYSVIGICLRHTVCPPGEGVHVNGTPERDVECAKCEHGSFSNESSSTASCRPHSACGPDQTSVPGSATHDIFCSSCKANSIQPQDDSACYQEAVRLVLERLSSEHQKKKLLRALKRVIQSSSDNLQELFDLLLGKSPSGLDTLLQALDQARLRSLRSTIDKWFRVQH